MQMIEKVKFASIRCDRILSKKNTKFQKAFLYSPHATSKTFSGFVRSQPDDVTKFFRSIFLSLKKEGFKDYHFSIFPSYPEGKIQSSKLERYFGKPNDLDIDKNKWFIMILARLFEDEATREANLAPDSLANFKDTDPVSFQDKTGRLIKQDLTHGDMLVRRDEVNQTRAVFDAQGRPMYVIISEKEKIYTVGDLSDAELLSCLSHIVSVSQTEDGSDGFQDIRLNCGIFQNIKNLHFKVWMNEARFAALNKENHVFKMLRRP